MSRSITLHYTPRQEDYAKVLRLFFWQRLSTKISLVIMVIAFGLVLYTILTKGTPPTAFELIWLILPPLFVMFVFIIQPDRIARKAAANEQLVTETTWELNEAGIQISSRFGSTVLEWAALDRLVTTKEYYLLIGKATNAFRFLPRRTFTTAQEETEFLDLVGKSIHKH